jgi:hypothetical protein
MRTSPHFLLIYRERLRFGALVVQAPSLADALFQAAEAGLDAPNSFRLAQQIDAELVTLVPPEQVGRILSRTEARELLGSFEASIKAFPRRPRRYVVND